MFQKMQLLKQIKNKTKKNKKLLRVDFKKHLEFSPSPNTQKILKIGYTNYTFHRPMVCFSMM